METWYSLDPVGAYSSRAHTEPLPPIECEPGVTDRKVQQKGEVYFLGHVVEVRPAFRGNPVGIVSTTEEGQ